MEEVFVERTNAFVVLLTTNITELVETNASTVVNHAMELVLRDTPCVICMDMVIAVIQIREFGNVMENVNG